MELCYPFMSCLPTAVLGCLEFLFITHIDIDINALHSNTILFDFSSHKSKTTDIFIIEWSYQRYMKFPTMYKV